MIRAERGRAAPGVEQGNAGIVMLGGVVMVMFLLVGLTDLASFFLARTRAQTAADSAALAAVAELIPAIGEDPEGKAEEYANANGAELVRCDCAIGSQVAEVTVAVPLRMTFTSSSFIRADAKAEISLPAGPGG